SDEKFVCKMCMVSDHQGHSVVSLKEEYEQRKSQIGNKVGEMKKFIKKKQTKIQYIRDSVELSNEAADRQKAEGFLVFNNLRQYVDQGLKNFFDTIEEKQRSKEKQAEGVITELEEEISVLMRRSSEVKDLSRSENYLSLLQTLTSFKALHTKNSKADIHPSSYEGSVFRAVVELENILHEEMRKAKLKLIQRYAVDVTVDPDTAHPRLVLSKDGRQVSSNNEWRAVKDSPKRFSVWLNVLGKQSFSSGMFYFEVQVREKNEWYLGVGCQSMKRKQRVPLNPENGYWTLQLKNDGYSACVDPDVCLHLRSSPQKIGVFVDYDSGVVSFYDVHSAELIYSFTNCSFKEKLYPFFNPGRNDSGENAAPLIITPDILTSTFLSACMLLPYQTDSDAHGEDAFYQSSVALGERVTASIPEQPDEVEPAQVRCNLQFQEPVTAISTLGETLVPPPCGVSSSSESSGPVHVSSVKQCPWGHKGLLKVYLGSACQTWH
ncbi:hypothetical protein GOODEAATRI_024761, partial [Goodea atripinnis]